MDSTTYGNFMATEASIPDFYTKSCKLYFFIFGSLLGGSLIVIGLLGNCISVTILRQERKKSSTIQALCLLAVADTGLLLAYCLFPIMDTQWANDINSFGIYPGVHMFEVARICNQVSALLTMVLMWQRYVAVCMPHKAKQLCTVRMVNRIAACSAVAAVAFYMPNFFLFSFKTGDDGFYYAESNPLVHNESFQMIHSVVLTYLVSYIIPVVSLLYMSVAILKSLKSHSQNVASTANSQHARKDLTKSSIAIVVVYVICQSLQPIRRILMWAYDPYIDNVGCGGELFYFSYVPHLALILNSSANFGIYILFARGFRRKLVGFLTRRNAVGPNDSTDNSTRAGMSNTNAMVETGTGSKSPNTALVATDDKKMQCSDTKAISDAGTADTI
ncbi:hypothetical protein CAPTEDRAFT_217805 [Capitella teleta]|uniref:G-protein coupled receptors family 1 profile domain-containing protein n=1 Tax=Capitella teleta TaxID=283909 RepID=R7TVC7_CAPTE|nr:hypothetical protein CAPTEDRAFT_217805 [Capitella teleta]|eukprot:ELT94970.1 hypothetical protein CAPTEDRAFT_217805 [Capitella teleta]